MNVIFLDIDGVLNSQLYYETPEHEDLIAKANSALADCNSKTTNHETCDKTKCQQPCVRTSKDWEGHDIDPRTLKLLNDLIDKTSAKIVVTSTWRGSHTRPELQSILKSRGFKHELFGYTPRCNVDCLRGNEILKWIKDNEKTIGKNYHEFRSYVIFDDDSDMLYWQKDNFILVDSYVGLTPRNCWRAEFIMTGTHK